MGGRAVILGVSGQIGAAVARRLLLDGWDVAGLHRGDTPLAPDLASADGLRVVLGDRADDAVVAAAVGSGADALVDVVGYDETHARQLLRHAPDLAALTVISSAAVYADADSLSIGGDAEPRWPVPVTEEQSLVPADATTYGGGKVLFERTLLDAAALPVTVLRGGAVHGAGSRHLREWWFVQRVLDGRRRVPLAHGGRSRFQPVAVANLAAQAVWALGQRSSQVLNAGDPDCPTVAEIGALVAAVTGHEWELVPLTAGGGRVGQTPWSLRHPFVLSMVAARRLGWEPVTTYAEALPGLVDAARAEVGERDWREVYPVLTRYPWDLFDYAAEDALLARLRTP